MRKMARLVCVRRVAVGLGPDVADVMAFWAVVLLMVNVVDLHLDWYLTYPGDDLNEVGLRGHAEDVLHAER